MNIDKSNHKIFFPLFFLPFTYIICVRDFLFLFIFLFIINHNKKLIDIAIIVLFLFSFYVGVNAFIQIPI